MRFLTVLTFLCVAQLLSAQARFYKLYSGTGFDKGEDVLTLPDSTFVVAGSSGSWEDNAQGFLMKLDQQGNYVWSQAYGAQESEEVKRVFHRPGMGYYLAGMSNSWSAGAYEPMLIYTDLNGNQQWIKTYPSAGWGRIHDGVMTADTGFVLVGERQAISGAEADFFAMRLDKNGDTLWTKSWGSAGIDRLNTILKDGLDTFVVAGLTYIPDSSCQKGYIIKLSGAGQIVWEDTLGQLSGNFEVLDITQTPYGYMCAGAQQISTTNHNYYTAMVAASGQILSQFVFDDAVVFSNDRVQQIAYLPQQDVCAVGIQVQNSGTYAQPFDINFAYADALFGYFLTGWATTLVLNEGYDHCGNIRPTYDGGLVAVGYNSIIGDGQNELNGGSNVYVLKLDQAGGGFIQTDTVFTTNQLVGLSPLFEGSQVLMFPNPVTDVLHFNWDGSEAKLIEIHDVVGNLLQRETITPAQTIDLDNWPQGVYYVRINGRSYPLVKH
jgi:hypothetical protein